MLHRTVIENSILKCLVGVEWYRGETCGLGSSCIQSAPNQTAQVFFPTQASTVRLHFSRTRWSKGGLGNIALMMGGNTRMKQLQDSIVWKFQGKHSHLEAEEEKMLHYGNILR